MQHWHPEDYRDCKDKTTPPPPPTSFMLCILLISHHSVTLQSSLSMSAICLIHSHYKSMANQVIHRLQHRRTSKQYAIEHWSYNCRLNAPTPCCNMLHIEFIVRASESGLSVCASPSPKYRHTNLTVSITTAGLSTLRKLLAGPSCRKKRQLTQPASH